MYNEAKMNIQISTWVRKPYLSGEELCPGEGAGVVLGGAGQVDQLGHSNEAEGQDEDGDVQQEQPFEQHEVGLDAAAKVALNLLDGGPPELSRVGQVGQPLLEALPGLVGYGRGTGRGEGNGKGVQSQSCLIPYSQAAPTHVHRRTHPSK